MHGAASPSSFVYEPQRTMQHPTPAPRPPTMAYSLPQGSTRAPFDRVAQQPLHAMPFSGMVSPRTVPTYWPLSPDHYWRHHDSLFPRIVELEDTEISVTAAQRGDHSRAAASASYDYTAPRIDAPMGSWSWHSPQNMQGKPATATATATATGSQGVATPQNNQPDPGAMPHPRRSDAPAPGPSDSYRPEPFVPDTDDQCVSISISDDPTVTASVAGYGCWPGSTLRSIHDVCLEATKRYLNARLYNYQLRAAAIPTMADRSPGRPGFGAGPSRHHLADYHRRARRFCPYDMASEYRQSRKDPRNSGNGGGGGGGGNGTAIQVIRPPTDSLLANVAQICELLWRRAGRDRLEVPDCERIAAHDMSYLLRRAETVAFFAFPTTVPAAAATDKHATAAAGVGSGLNGAGGGGGGESGGGDSSDCSSDGLGYGGGGDDCRSFDSFDHVRVRQAKAAALDLCRCLADEMAMTQIKATVKLATGSSYSCD